MYSTSVQIVIKVMAMPGGVARMFKVKIGFLWSSHEEKRNNAISSGMKSPRKATEIMMELNDGFMAAM